MNGTTRGASRLSTTTHQHGAPHGLTWATTRASGSDYHLDHSDQPRYPMSDVPAPESAPSSSATPERATLDIPEIAHLLGCSRGTAYRAAREGRLPALRIGRRLVVPRRAFDQWLASAAEPLRDPSPTLSDVCRWQSAHSYFRLRLRLRPDATPTGATPSGLESGRDIDPEPPTSDSMTVGHRVTPHLYSTVARSLTNDDRDGRASSQLQQYQSDDHVLRQGAAHLRTARRPRVPVQAAARRRRRRRRSRASERSRSLGVMARLGHRRNDHRQGDVHPRGGCQ